MDDQNNTPAEWMNDDDKPNGEYMDFSQLDLHTGSMAPLDPEELTRVLIERKLHVLNAAKRTACQLSCDWWNFLSRDPNPNKPVEAEVWAYAHDLFFTLLPQYIAIVQRTVAGHVAGEFGTEAAREIANQIREANFE